MTVLLPSELRMKREALGLSREALAERSGVSVNTIVRHEKGRLGHVRLLARHLDALGLENAPPSAERRRPLVNWLESRNWLDGEGG